MPLQGLHLYLFFFIIIIFFAIIPCYYCLQGDTLNHYLQEEDGYDSGAYPSYINSIEDGHFKVKIFDDKVGSISTSVHKVNVDDFKPNFDNNHDDDTEAFEKAWEEACSSEEGAVIVVPEKKYRLKPVRFSGPCKSNITVQIYGIIEASDDRSDYEEDERHWLVFDKVENLLVEGGGTIDGNGNIWWQNSCKVDKDLPCKDAPTALTFYRCQNLVVDNLTIQNAQQMHISFQRSKDVQVSNLNVTSPEHSPNTDGIHVTHTNNIQIANSSIGTGDDCISIVSGSQNVQAKNISCGPGHGISIGSLGSRHSKDYVSEVTIDGAEISGTTNGVRIKTWQGGSGIAKNIKFQNIEMHNVSNPIIINQYYCDHHKPCKEQKSAVKVKNVMYKNIKGTSATEVAIKFDCSKAYPCQDILLQHYKKTGYQ
ncbi:hypothetical protein MANES_09G024100v8 [Manihot esculenta]|uniref:Uncharacterized protein n=1 Tax=Manihot esculenta TaxID=3983 RepID=A0ACB7H1W8_MANES|nr:hypothetical protein MANES_09G024100v8 [Manihot esculenta]